MCTTHQAVYKEDQKRDREGDGYTHETQHFYYPQNFITRQDLVTCLLHEDLTELVCSH